MRVGNEEADCPNYPFNIPDDESLTTDTHIYISERRILNTNRWTTGIAISKLNYRFKTHVAPIVLEVHHMPKEKNSLIAMTPIV